MAVSQKPVGVNIQSMIEYSANLAKRICNENEIAGIKYATDFNKAITKLWVQKESLIKLKGQTIGQDLKTVLEDVGDYKFSFFELEKHVACVCEKIKIQSL